MWVTIFLASVAIFSLYSLISALLSHQRLKFYINKIPGPSPNLPVIGNALEFIFTADSLWATYRLLSKKYYPIYKFWFAKYAIVNILHPDDIEVLLTNKKNITKGRAYDFTHAWFGLGLVTSTGEKWKIRRRILTPAFHFNILRDFTKIFDQEGRRIVGDLISGNGEVTQDLMHFVSKYTLNAICETAMGTSLASIEKENDNFYQTFRNSVHSLEQTIILRLQSPWLYPDFIFYSTKWGRLQQKCIDIVNAFSRKIIEERKKFHDEIKDVKFEKLDENTDVSNEINIFKIKKRKLAMLDLLVTALKNDHNIDDDGIFEEVNTFIFAGHDTVATSLCFTILLLAEHPDIQQRAREEVDEVMRNTQGYLSITELQQLSYLERCIKESLRLYPSVPSIGRVLTEDLQLKNYLIPKDAIIQMHIYDLHRDPNFWPDPLRYDPDRFLPENTPNRHRFAYIPFSSGPRNCIGQKFAMLELKAIIGHVLHHFYMEPKDIAADIQINADIVLRPKNSVQVKFVPRQFSS